MVTLSKTLTVRNRIIATVIIFAVLGFTLVGFTTYFVQRQLVLEQIDEKLLSVSEQLSHVAETAPLNEQETEPVRELMVAVMQRVVVDHNSSIVGVIGGSARLTPAMEVDFRLENHSELLNRAHAELAEFSYTETVMGSWRAPTGETFRYLATPVVDELNSQQGFLLSAYDLQAEMAEIDQTMLVFMITAVIAMIIIALVVYIVSGRLLRPIRTLQQTADEIGATDLSRRIPVTGNDDVSQLTQTINTMLGRIESEVSAQQQLIKDVRHELRTPITVMRGNAELLDPNDPDEVAEVQELMLEELDRLSNLVTDLTVLAEANERGFINPEWIDFSNFFAKLSAKGELLLAETDKSFAAQSSVDGVLWLDQDRATQVVLQLIDNAKKYAPAGSLVEVQASAELTDPTGPKLLMKVSDNGPALSQEDSQKIFERFARLRTSPTTEGSGLGLSIVQSILQAQGGSIRLETGSETGNTFVCSIPLIRPSL